MLTLLTNPWRVLIRETLGLRHAAQVIAIPAPPGSADQGVLATSTGQHCQWQRSRRDPAHAFVFLSTGVAPDSEMQLTPVAEVPLAVVRRHESVVSNGIYRLQLNHGAGTSHGGIHPGPLRAVAIGDGPWRGRHILDTRHDTCRWSSEFSEDGPVRCVWSWRAEIGSGHYTCTITVNAGVGFAQLDEDFAGGAADQVIFDLSAADLPREAWIMTNEGGHRSARFDTTTDHRLGNVWSWTQMSQMVPNTDGIVFAHADGGVIGVVALRGGTWRGNRLNHVEAWIRRWHDEDPQTRRGWPAVAKHDATFSDGVAERGQSVCHAHAGFEGWIGQGSRCTALVLDHATTLAPRGGAPGAGPWADRPNPQAWAAVQGGLRRIHTQHGLLPLQDQLGWVLDWAQERCVPQVPVRALNHYHDHVGPVNGELDRLADYLAARLHGCWYGAGLEEANPVVGRPLPLAMLSWSPRFAAGLADSRVPRLRAWFAALAYLNASDSCYPGAASMRPHGDADGFEPTLRGMANQNFLTDVIMVHGAFAEAFPGHPCAPAWRERCAMLWQRQLAFHCHPESGVWEESHTYYQHVLVTICAPLIARRDAGHGDGFADPALHRLLGVAIDQLTPADRRLDGACNLIPFGDHTPETQRYREGWHLYSEALAPHAPRLASELMGCYRACGGQQPSAVPAITPAWQHRHLTGLGVVWRGRDELIALRSGGSWGHHHHDDGTLLVWGSGQQLIADAGSAGEGIGGLRKYAAEGHSRWAPRDWEPLNYLDRQNRGRILASDLAATQPWAIAWCPTRNAVIRRGQGFLPAMMGSHHFEEPIRHQRLVVHLGPGALLVVDRGEGREPGIVRWHLCGEAVLVDAQSVRAALPDGRILWLVTSHGECSLGQRDVPKDARLTTQEVRCHVDHAKLACTLVTWGSAVAPLLSHDLIAHGDQRWPLQISEAVVVIGSTRITWPEFPE